MVKFGMTRMQAKDIVISNEQAAKEWLTKAWHNLSTSQLLYKVDHYTDIIAVELHYTCEKTLKALFACQNKKIPKTHDLLEIYNVLEITLYEDMEIKILDQISEYHIEESYPSFNRALPPREEMKIVLDFTETLFFNVCCMLNIEQEEIQK